MNDQARAEIVAAADRCEMALLIANMYESGGHSDLAFCERHIAECEALLARDLAAIA